MRKTTMRRVLTSGLLLLMVVAATACARPTMSTPLLLSAQPIAIVLATAIIAPDALVGLVRESVEASPQSAVPVAAAASAAAPDQALTIRATVIRLVPAAAEAVVAVTKVPRRAVAARVDIPTHETVAALVERATR